MPDPYDLGDSTTAPSTGGYFAPPLVANDRAAAQQFLNYHRQQTAGREGQVQDAEKQQQENLARMSKVLDDTTAALKAARTGRSNLPMMMFGAGMLSTPGNFGTQLGGGLRAAGQAIQQDRDSDSKLDLNMANLAIARAGMENAPLKEKLAYIRALQVGDINAQRMIESSLIRAQGQDATRGQQQVAKAVQDSIAEARRQFEAGNKEMYTTAEEAEAEINRLVRQQIEIRRAAGIDIPDAVLDKVLQPKIPGQPAPGVTGRREAKGFTPMPEQEAAINGLPNKPPAYIYDQIGPKQKAETLASERKNWNKLSEDWMADTEKAQALEGQLDAITGILDKNPKVVGRQHMVPNSMVPNFSEDAQKLQSMFNNINLNGVPKGQGAVSNFERELFSSASPNMGIGADANKELIGMMKRVLTKRNDYRDFLNNYFGAYGTVSGANEAWKRYVDSPVGSMVLQKEGKFVPNPDYKGWRDYFRAERAPPVEKQEGGPIRLDTDG